MQYFHHLIFIEHIVTWFLNYLNSNFYFNIVKNKKNCNIKSFSCQIEIVIQMKCFPHERGDIVI